jgi:hypothetical protein
VEQTHDDAAAHNGWMIQVQFGLATARCTADGDFSRCYVHKDPPTLFVPSDWIARRRVGPGLLQRSLNHGMISQLVRIRRSILHPNILF